MIPVQPTLACRAAIVVGTVGLRLAGEIGYPARIEGGVILCQLLIGRVGRLCRDFVHDDTRWNRWQL